MERSLPGCSDHGKGLGKASVAYANSKASLRILELIPVTK